MINNFLNTSLIYGIGFVLLRGLSFILLPLYTNLLNTFDAGIVFIVYALLAFLNPFFAFGMDSALMKFFNSPSYTKKQVISSSLICLLISSSILAGIIFLISLGNIGFLNVQYNWLALIGLILFFDSISSRLLVLLRLLERPWYYLAIGLINIISSLVLNIVFIYSCQFGDKGAAYALLGTSIIQFLWLMPVMYKYINFSVFHLDLSKKMFLFGLPFLPSAILFIITGMVDRFFIQHYLDLTQVGIYGAGYKIASIVSIVVIAFNLSWQPYYLKSHSHSSFINNIKYISQSFFIVLLYITTFIALWSEILIKIKIFDFNIIGADFWDGIIVVPWIAFGYFFYGMFVLQMPTIYICNKQIWSPVFWGSGALINIILNVALIPSLGIRGAGISTLASYLTMFLFIVYKNQKWLPINFVTPGLCFYFILNLIVIFVIMSINVSQFFMVVLFTCYSFVCCLFLLYNKPVSSR